MSVEPPLDVVLCWHMHQPDYREPGGGEYVLPWTYLHAVKDYVDMAAHLEAVPEARAVVNFVPILLEQITDYARQVRAYLTEGGPIRDPLLAALASPALPTDPADRLKIIESCLRANRERVIDRYPAFHRLAQMAGWLENHAAAVCYLSDRFLGDLLVWYHLGWLGETVHRGDVRAKRLVAKAQDFTLHDRYQLLELIGELLGGIVERYRRLAQDGRIELSMTPYAHPIVPLLLDLQSAREAEPQLPMPELTAYPGGAERARWHVAEGLRVFEDHFGMRPAGCWPSEGGVSTAALDLLAGQGMRWAATGEGVLANSLRAAGRRAPKDGKDWLYTPYRVGEQGSHCFFRDDGLSDLIGFTYSDWHADDAVGDLAAHLERIADAGDGRDGRIVSIILDGENAWEHYPENGFYFLSSLYRRLSRHPRLRLTTFSEHLDRAGAAPALPRVVAGSWVYGSFTTWIGDRDKNRAWDLLGAAKAAYDRVLAAGGVTPERLAALERQLGVCEGSDWFWWFGDYNPASTVSDFERLYRAQLAGLYRLLGEEPPGELSEVLSHGGGAPRHGGAMRPGQARA
jgi:alpha-amylase/alpha-mannosidase (GH57 family)